MKEHHPCELPPATCRRRARSRSCRETAGSGTLEVARQVHDADPASRPRAWAGQVRRMARHADPAAWQPVPSLASSSVARGDATQGDDLIALARLMDGAASRPRVQRCAFIDTESLPRLTQHPVRTTYRSPGNMPMPPSDALIVAQPPTTPSTSHRGDRGHRCPDPTARAHRAECAHRRSSVCESDVGRKTVGSVRASRRSVPQVSVSSLAQASSSHTQHPPAMPRCGATSGSL